MTALEFVKTAQRWAKAQELDTAIIVRTASPGAIVERMETWAAEHPSKTRLSKLLKLFPHMRLNAGIPDLCPKTMDTQVPELICKDRRCADCIREFWLEGIDDD